MANDTQKKFEVALTRDGAYVEAMFKLGQLDQARRRLADLEGNRDRTLEEVNKHRADIHAEVYADERYKNDGARKAEAASREAKHKGLQHSLKELKSKESACLAARFDIDHLTAQVKLTRDYLHGFGA